MKLNTCIFTSSLDNPSEASYRDSIFDIIPYYFQDESGSDIAITFTKINQRVKELEDIPTRAKYEDQMLRDYRDVLLFMRNFNIDAIVIDDRV